MLWQVNWLAVIYFSRTTSDKRFREKMLLTNRMINFEIILQAARENQWLGSKKLKPIATGSHFTLNFIIVYILQWIFLLLVVNVAVE